MRCIASDGQVVRKESWKGSTLWYNLAGPAEWELVSLDAALPAEAQDGHKRGLLENVSLLQ